MAKKVIAWDTETCLIRPGLPAPPLVCLSHQQIGQDPTLEHWMTSEGLLRAWLEDPEVLLVGHNVAYDAAVCMAAFPDLIPAWIAKYDQDGVTDTLVREQLLDIADGVFGRSDKRYGLQDLFEQYDGRVLDKDTWRLRYGELRDLSLDQWPEGAKLYPLDDARATLLVGVFQSARKHLLLDQFRQTRAALALHLSASRGLRTDSRCVEALAREYKDRRDALEPALRDARLVRPSGQRNNKVLRGRVTDVYLAAGRPVPMTDPKKSKKKIAQVAVDTDTCRGSGDELLIQFADWSEACSVLAKSVPALMQGVVYPIHTRYWLAASGRTTSRGVNVQNFSREGGERECFRPRSGYVYLNADFDQFELRGLAQVCLEWFGKSKLADLLNSGADPHVWFAGLLLGLSYEDCYQRYLAGDKQAKEYRQMSKAALFGFPGGMGISKFITYAAGYKLKLSVSRAEWLKAQWLAAFPEMLLYFEKIGGMQGADDRFTVSQLYSNRLRANCAYTSACNSYFQGICADAAKEALWRVTKACYADPGSPLYGSYIVAFVHDEYLLETSPENMQAKGDELCRLMCEGANKYLKKVPAKTAPKAMSVWSKDASTVRGLGGNLAVWSPWVDAAVVECQALWAQTAIGLVPVDEPECTQN